MSGEWSMPAWAIVVAVVAVALLCLAVVALARSVRGLRRDADDALALARAETAEVRAHLLALERRLASRRTDDEREYTITTLGQPDDAEPEPAPAAPVVPGPLFADLVMREGVVQTASLVAGLRRALSAEHRNRMRFEMRREIKRARRQRRADLRTARREYEARQRSGMEPA